MYKFAFLDLFQTFNANYVLFTFNWELFYHN